MRRALLGPAGPWVVRVLCGWELASLMPGSPLPPLTQLNRKHRWIGGVLLLLGLHHLYFEMPPPPTD